MKKTRILAAGLMVLLAFTTAGCGKESVLKFIGTKFTV